MSNSSSSCPSSRESSSTEGSHSSQSQSRSCSSSSSSSSSSVSVSVSSSTRRSSTSDLMESLLVRFGASSEGSTLLSQTPRGIVKSIPSSRQVLRIGRRRVKKGGGSCNSEGFTSYFWKHQCDVHSLVPILSPPLVVNDVFVVDRFAEVVFNEDSESPTRRHVDLHEWTASNRDDVGQICKYLYDVILTVADLHDHGWTHMDLSLENVAITPNRAFVIDFESCTEFFAENGGFTLRQDVVGPLKLPFVPPEHLKAKRGDHVHLPSYDVWAFGTMMFGALFQSYLIGSFDPETKRVTIEESEIDFLCRNGLAKFILTFHPRVWRILTVKPKEYDSNQQQRDAFDTLRLAFHLMSHIFVKAKRKKTKNGNDGVFHYPHKRFNARQVAQHPFWERVGACDMTSSLISSDLISLAEHS